MPLKKLQIQRDIVALEAFSVSDVTGLFKNFMPSIKASFQEISNSFNPSAAGVALLPSSSEFLKDIPKHSYMDVKILSAFVPEGMDAKYRAYAEVLLRAAKHAAEAPKRLSDFNVYLGRLHSATGGHRSTEDGTLAYRDMEKTRKEINREIGDCFTSGSSRVETTIGKVIDRNADWQDIFAMCDAMTSEVMSVDRKKLQKQIQDCNEFLAAVERKLKAAEFEGVSPNVVQNLADGAYQLASELEFFAATYYRVEVFVTSVNRTVKHFQNVMTPA